jgi:hypothetical protein
MGRRMTVLASESEPAASADVDEGEVVALVIACPKAVYTDGTESDLVTSLALC